MRKEILAVLRASGSKPVSGEKLAEKLQLSRTAIWKHMQALKNAGYHIKAIAKKGYVLESAPDKLFPTEIEAYLQTKWLGRQLEYKETVTSTNEIAKARAMTSTGAVNGLVCVAEEQTGGHGRLSRGWFSPYGKGLWFSMVLTPSFLPEKAPKCTLLAAVAVVKAINQYAGVDATIKWPNDILLHGKKLVGILTEMNAEFGHINYVVIGIGVNVCVPRAMVPKELRASAISLTDVAKEKINRTELLAAVLKNFEELYEMVLQEGFDQILTLWRHYSSTLNQEVKVVAPDETYVGTAVDIDNDGLLMVKRQDGKLTKVVAGDVSIRAVHPQSSKYQ